MEIDTNKLRALSIGQQAQLKRPLPLYNIDVVTHLKKQKIQALHANVILKIKHFHWKVIHDKEFKNLMITFPSFTLNNVANKFLVNNPILELKFIQIYFHLYHIHKLKKILTKNINSYLNNIQTSTNTCVNVNLNSIQYPQ
jgi:hypothetical protein